MACAAPTWAQSCSYPGSVFCIFGALYWGVPPYQYSPIPFNSGGPTDQKGPIDICYDWDTDCSSPVYSICKVHKNDGAYTFVMPTHTAWRTKPRVAYGHLSWYPEYNSYYTETDEYGYLEFFVLTSDSGSGDNCNW